MITVKRYYQLIRAEKDSNLQKKVPQAHITIAEYYICDNNGKTTNQINGLLNSTKSTPFRTAVQQILVSKNIAFQPIEVTKMGNSDFIGVKLNMTSNTPNYEFQDFIHEVNNIIFQKLNLHSSFAGVRLEMVPPNTLSFLKGGKATPNTTTWPMWVAYDKTKTPFLWLRIYSPAIPHMSLVSQEDIKMNSFKVETVKTNKGGKIYTNKFLSGTQVGGSTNYVKKYLKYKQKYNQIKI